MLTKQCSKCGQELASSLFRVDVNCKSGVRSSCILCERVASRERRRLAGAKIRPEIKPEIKLSRTKEYRREERRKAAEKAGKRYEPRDLEYRQMRRLIKSEILALKRIAEKVTAGIKKRPWQSKYLSEASRKRIRYRMDPAFNLKERLRRQITKQMKKDSYADLIRSAISRNGESPTVARVFGYSIKELKASIESKFEEGMSWNEFLAGKIHIDHIKPVSAHDLSSNDEFVSCWSLANLQPLWARDNLVKSAKWQDCQ